MNCTKCGAPLMEGDQFCKACGTPVTAPVTPNNFQPQQPMEMVNQQPMQPNMPVNQNGYQNNYNQQPKQNSPVKYIVIGIVAVVVIVIVGIIIINLIKNKSGSGSGPSISDNPGTNQTVNKTYKVNLNGFTFAIPDNLLYDVSNGTLRIGDEDNTWVAQIEMNEGSFAQLKARKNQLRSQMEKIGYGCSDAVEKTVKGVEFITMEISYGGQNALAALTKANSMYLVAVTILNVDNEFDYDLLNTIAPIIDSVIDYCDNKRYRD